MRLQDEPLRFPAPATSSHPASGGLAPSPPLTLPRCRTILPHQPNCWIHNGKLSYDPRAEPTATASQPHPAAYNPQGS